MPFGLSLSYSASAAPASFRRLREVLSLASPELGASFLVSPGQFLRISLTFLRARSLIPGFKTLVSLPLLAHCTLRQLAGLPGHLCLPTPTRFYRGQHTGQQLQRFQYSKCSPSNASLPSCQWPGRLAHCYDAVGCDCWPSSPDGCAGSSWRPPFTQWLHQRDSLRIHEAHCHIDALQQKSMD